MIIEEFFPSAAPAGRDESLGGDRARPRLILAESRFYDTIFTAAPSIVSGALDKAHRR